MTGNAANGKTVFMNACALCHMVNNEGYDFGPKLTEIGGKAFEGRVVGSYPASLCRN